MDFPEFTLGFGESGMECGSEVSWRDGMNGSVDHFQGESVGYELEKGDRMRITHSMDNSGNK